MVETINHSYEVSSESAICHWPVRYARMTDVTPTPTQPAEVTSLTAGRELTGTVLVVDAANSVAVVDFTCGMVYQHNVRNVLIYAGAVENTWGAIAEGATVYYDSSATMVALGLKLSTSPLDNLGGVNPVFGRVVAANPVDAFVKGGIVASTQVCAVLQVGAGGS